MAHDIESVAEMIDGIAERLHSYGRDIERIAKTVRRTQDLSRVPEVLSEIKNCFANLRTDLLMSRVLTMLELEERIKERENEPENL